MTTKAFRRLLGIWTGALLLFGAVFCLLLYRYLAAYEATRPELLMEQLLSERSAEDWIALTEDALSRQLSPYESPQALLDTYLPEDAASLTPTVRRELSRDGDSAVFLLRLGSTRLCRVTLQPRPDGKARFGRHDWELKSVDASAMLDKLHTLSVEIDKLPRQNVLLNGLPLQEEDLVGSVEAPGLSSLERRFGSPPQAERYRVERLYGELSVTLDGELLTPREEDGVLRFSPAEHARKSVTVVAPDDVRVSVGGMALSEDEVESRSDGILAGLGAYTRGDGYQTLRYVFSLYQDLPVTARDADGQELESIVAADGTIYFFHANDPDYQARAASYVQEYFFYYLDYGSSARNFFPLLGRILPGTALYQEIFESQEAMLWLSPTKASNENWSFDNFSRVNDSCFTCTIRYRADLISKDRQGEHESTLHTLYELCFVRINDKYYVAAMTTIDL